MVIHPNARDLFPQRGFLKCVSMHATDACEQSEQALIIACVAEYGYCARHFVRNIIPQDTNTGSSLLSMSLADRNATRDIDLGFAAVDE